MLSRNDPVPKRKRFGRVVAVGLASILVSHAAEADNLIRILCPTWTGFAPVFVASDLGYFKALGIAVDMKFEDERPNVMAAMARGDIEMDMRTMGEFQGRPRDEDTPGVIIGTIDESTGGDEVIADGSIQSAADLKGRTVASEPNIPGRLMLQFALKKAGMTLNDVAIKEIVTADSVPVFTDKSITAIATFEPFGSQILKNDASRKPHVLLSSRNYPGLFVDSIIVRQDDLKANPDKYRKYLIGIFKAVAHFKADPADFIKLAAPHFNLSPADFKASIDGNLTYASYERNLEALGKPGAPGPMYAAFDTVMALNLENGAADHKLTAAHSIDNSILATIGPADLN